MINNINKLMSNTKYKTLTSLAIAAGLAPHTVIQWSNNERLETLLKYKRLAQTLNCTVDDLATMQDCDYR